jgi:HSP20 family protein
MDTKQTQMQKKETSDVQSAERTRWGKIFSPAIDIIETDNELKIYADMPGVDQKTIDITIDQGVLTIQGNVDGAALDEYELVYQEYDIGDFQRSFRLADSVDQEKISANYKEGVLELILPKAEKAKPRKIEVK